MDAADAGLSSDRPASWIRGGGRPAKASRGTGDAVVLPPLPYDGESFSSPSSESVLASVDPTDQTVGSQPCTLDFAAAKGDSGATGSGEGSGTDSDATTAGVFFIVLALATAGDGAAVGAGAGAGAGAGTFLNHAFFTGGAGATPCSLAWCLLLLRLPPCSATAPRLRTTASLPPLSFDPATVCVSLGSDDRFPTRTSCLRPAQTMSPLAVTELPRPLSLSFDFLPACLGFPAADTVAAAVFGALELRTEVVLCGLSVPVPFDAASVPFVLDDALLLEASAEPPERLLWANFLCGFCTT
eukprot:COSAG02_NODE_1681_length_11351_cov_20.077320_7_plen_299_part_00